MSGWRRPFYWVVRSLAISSRVPDSGVCLEQVPLRKRTVHTWKISPGTKKDDKEVLCDGPPCGAGKVRLLSRHGRVSVEDLWRHFFADPSQWWDHTNDKVNPKYPDFKHKITGAGLWINGRSSPSWLKRELKSLTPGSVSRSLYSWNVMISACVKSNQGLDALKLFNQMQAEGIQPDAFTFARVLNACARLKALEEGILVHRQVIQCGYESDVFVANTLVDMYAKCGRMQDAARLFHKMPTRDVVSWNSMLAGYHKCEQGQEALELFALMQQEGVKPNAVTFVALVNACASILSLEEGRHIHALLIQSGCEYDMFVGSSLVDMYAKCESIEDAQRVFQKMPTRDVVAWTAMLAGYLKCDLGHKALDLFGEMHEQGVMPNIFTFAVMLNACASLKALEEGRRVHMQLIQSGCKFDMFVESTLVDMYAKCGSMEDAQRVFNKMPSRDVVCWTAMLSGYLQCKKGQKTLELFLEMQAEGVNPSLVTLVVVLNACASIMALEEGKCIHTKIVELGWESDMLVGGSLVDMYAKCGTIKDASSVFQKMPTRNLIAWNAMLTGYVKCEQGQKALELFSVMQGEGMEPDCVTFIAVLNACASIVSLQDGRCIHGQLIESSCEPNVFVGSSLVDMYAKCGSIEDAQRVFLKMSTRDVVTWTSMLAGYVNCGEGVKALELFPLMQQEGLKPDLVTYVVVLSACASIMALEEGRRVHTQLIQSGCDWDMSVSSTLVDMYAKCGSIEDAQRVFQNMPTRDVVAWTAMLGGFAMHGLGKEALQFFQDMHDAGVEMNRITFICVLSACSHGGLAEEGVQLFQSMGSVYGIEPTGDHYGCMVDIFGRAGRLDEAEDLLISEPKLIKDSIALMALLSACRKYGKLEIRDV